MSSTQPEALRLAELMDYLSTDSYEWWQEFDKCAAELRRLYAEVDRLSYQLAYPDNFVKEPEQEAVARSKAYDMIDRFLQNNLNSDEDYAEYSKALDSIYTSPPQRQPLTDEQIKTRTDEQIEATFKRCGGRWNGDHWVIEDADLHPFVRTIEGADLNTLRAISDEYNAWIKHHAAGHSYDDFLSRQAAHSIN